MALAVTGCPVIDSGDKIVNRKQLFLRNLDGKTLCFQLPYETVSGEVLKSLLEERTGIPKDSQRLVTGLRDISDDSVLSTDDCGEFPSCTVLLRLIGGKGGFGSLLRGAATKAGQKKTSNFDACRDMSGRRLRHVNAEKQLKEWKAEAKDRELEKAGEEHVKRLARERRENAAVQEELESLRAESTVAMDSVDDAVKIGLVEAKKQKMMGKRKMEQQASEALKRNKLWDMLETLADDEDLDEEEEEGEDEDEDEEDVEFRVGKGNNEGSCSVEPSSTAEDSARGSSDGEEERSKLPCLESSDEETLAGSPGNEGQKNQTGRVSEEVASVGCETRQYDEASNMPEQPVIKASLTGDLDFTEFSTGAELEVLGMDRLKEELQQRGLKCGGSLSERAGRLFLLKETPLSNLDKKHFAKPVNSKKR